MNEMLTVDYLARSLVMSRIIDADAVDDPDGYDDGVTMMHVKALHRRLIEVIEKSTQQPMDWNQELANLLCRIHRDGGHYIAEHGWRKAIDDADLKVANMNAESDNLSANSENEAPINWELNGDKDCGYTNWLGKTQFGRILITWKGWKEYHDACVDEFPGGFQAYGEPDDVKAACEAEYIRRLGRINPPRREWQGLTEEEVMDLVRDECADMRWPSTALNIARAIEATLKEKNHE